MFSAYLAWRYLYGARENFLLKMMTYAAIGILSVIIATLIVTSGLSNAFHKLLINNAVDISGHIQVSTQGFEDSRVQNIEGKLNDMPQIDKYYSGVNRYSIVSNADFSCMQGVYMYGFDLPKKQMQNNNKIIDDFLNEDFLNDGFLNNDIVPSNNVLSENKELQDKESKELQDQNVNSAKVKSLQSNNKELNSIDLNRVKLKEKQSIKEDLHEEKSINNSVQYAQKLSDQNEKQDLRLNTHNVKKDQVIKDSIGQTPEDHHIYSMLHIIDGTKQVSKNGVLIGLSLAQRLNCNTGDKINLVGKHFSRTMVGVIPKIDKYVIDGIFISKNDRLDNFVLIGQKTGEHLSNSVNNNIYVHMKNVYEKLDDHALQQSDKHRIYIRHWSDFDKNLFDMIVLESRIMYIVIFMVVMIFGMLSVVNVFLIIYEKKTDIVILRTMGMGNLSIAAVFCFIGLYISIIASIMGVALGYLIINNFSLLVNWISFLIGDLSEYIVSLPVVFSYYDIFYIVSSVIVINIVSVAIMVYFIFRKSLNLTIRMK